MGDESARYLDQILDLCDRLAGLVADAARRGAMPLVLGGDHSVALGSLVGMAQARGPGGVVWVDAHGDLNTPETSPTGNVHGMVLAAALGLAGDGFRRDGWPMPILVPGKLALVGVRSLDDGERKLVQTLDAKVFTMSEVDRIGIDRAPLKASPMAGAVPARAVHVDVVDPTIRRRRHACARRALVPRGAPRDGDGGGIAAARFNGRRRGQPDPRSRERHGTARRRARRLGARRTHPLVRFEVRDGDIAAVEADAVANAANDRLWMGAGVAGALKRAGGDEIEREATALGPFQRWQDPSWKRMTVSLR